MATIGVTRPLFTYALLRYIELKAFLTIQLW
jgi:hypothetical protein